MCKGAVGFDHAAHFRGNVPRPAHSDFVKVEQVDDLRGDAPFAWFLNVELYDFRSHLFHTDAIVVTRLSWIIDDIS